MATTQGNGTDVQGSEASALEGRITLAARSVQVAAENFRKANTELARAKQIFETMSEQTKLAKARLLKEKNALALAINTLAGDTVE